MNKSIYIHIPFCKSKCYYCDFVSDTNLDLIDKYIKFLIKEIDLYKKNLKNSNIETIYIGGGTPSVLSSKYISRIFKRIKKYNDLKNLKEFTIEINPKTINKLKLKKYKDIGINRLSIGLQSTNNKILKKLGRIHTFELFKQKYKLARDLGFENISLDLMFGLPSQSENLFKDTLKKVISLNPEHISAYSLKVEKGTKFYQLKKDNKLNLPSEALDRKMYKILLNILEKNNYNLYEISNFSKKDYKSKHNLAYWHRHNYFGFGVAAHGFLDNNRYGNFIDFDNYFKSIDKGKKPIEEVEVLNKEEKIFEEIMLRLRLTEGININEMNKKYKIDFLDRYKNVINSLKNQGVIKLKENRLFIKKEFFNVSNQIISEFI
ncbi:MAG: radical SAM family heme chaperone HemW [Bacillota bacterium]